MLGFIIVLSRSYAQKTEGADMPLLSRVVPHSLTIAGRISNQQSAISNQQSSISNHQSDTTQ
jgi:hypothetical protein